MDPSSQPRVSFIANVIPPTSANPAQQLINIQNDLRSNLTAYFAPTTVDITITVFSSGRRLLGSDTITASADQVHSQPGDVQNQKAQNITHGRGRSNRTPSWLVLNTILSHSLSRQGSRHGQETGRRVQEAQLLRRALLQASSVLLNVNVTFPAPAQQAGSQQVAVAFNQALLNNSTSVLSGFQQGWGATGVNGVQLIYLTQAAPAATTPIGAPPASGGGSIGTLVGIAVAAVLGCSVLAGQYECWHTHQCPIKVAHMYMRCLSQ